MPPKLNPFGAEINSERERNKHGVCHVGWVASRPRINKWKRTGTEPKPNRPAPYWVRYTPPPDPPAGCRRSPEGNGLGKYFKKQSDYNWNLEQVGAQRKSRLHNFLFYWSICLWNIKRSSALVSAPSVGRDETRRDHTITEVSSGQHRVTLSMTLCILFSLFLSIHFLYSTFLNPWCIKMKCLFDSLNVSTIVKKVWTMRSFVPNRSIGKLLFLRWY